MDVIILIPIGHQFHHHNKLVQALLMLGLNPSEQEVVDMPNEIARSGITTMIIIQYHYQHHDKKNTENQYTIDALALSTHSDIT